MSIMYVHENLTMHIVHTHMYTVQYMAQGYIKDILICTLPFCPGGAGARWRSECPIRRTARSVGQGCHWTYNIMNATRDGVRINICNHFLTHFMSYL